ncbi:MAG: two pore domain potassium channel family protein [Deltaproteobacteria bacterium]|nr:two pore domain potassium channel family protein [Deltaproteobacteria bacterium]
MPRSIRHLFLFLREPAFISLSIGGNLTLLISSFLVYLFERNVDSPIKTYFDAIWWGVATITTIGYGDVVPISLAGRLIGLALMYTGTVIFIAFTSLFASYWVRIAMEKDFMPLEKDVHREQRALYRMENLLEEMNERLELLEKKVAQQKNQKSNL